VRLAGQDDGLFGEAVRGITGLRRDPGAAVRAAQVAGRATPDLGTWNKAVSERLQYVPAFADWTLFQPNADGFEIRKRTKPGTTIGAQSRVKPQYTRRYHQPGMWFRSESRTPGSAGDPLR